MPKRSRLEVKKTSVRFRKKKTGQKVRFSNVFNKMAAKFGRHLAFTDRKPDKKVSEK